MRDQQFYSVYTSAYEVIEIWILCFVTNFDIRRDGIKPGLNRTSIRIARHQCWSHDSDNSCIDNTSNAFKNHGKYTLSVRSRCDIPITVETTTPREKRKRKERKEWMKRNETKKKKAQEKNCFDGIKIGKWRKQNAFSF